MIFKMNIKFTINSLGREAAELERKELDVNTKKEKKRLRKEDDEGGR